MQTVIAKHAKVSTMRADGDSKTREGVAKGAKRHIDVNQSLAPGVAWLLTSATVVLARGAIPTPLRAIKLHLVDHACY